MKQKSNGWVIINIGHPSNGQQFISTDSFRINKKAAIKSFVDGSSNTWIYWKAKYNFRCVRAVMTIETTKK